MGRLIDSDVLIRLERHERPLDLVLGAGDEPVGVAAITVSELLVGIHRADSLRRRRQRALSVEAVINAVQVLPLDIAVARVHADLWAKLSAAGASIGAHDLIIAATAVAYDFDLFTDNVREFGRVPGLRVLQPDW